MMKTKLSYHLFVVTSCISGCLFAYIFIYFFMFNKKILLDYIYNTTYRVLFLPDRTLYIKHQIFI